MFAMQRIKTQVLTICEGEFTRQQRQLSGESQISRSILACIIEADFQQSAGEGRLDCCPMADTLRDQMRIERG